MGSEMLKHMFHMEITSTLSRAINRRNGRKVLLWGMGLASEISSSVLDQLNVPIDGYIDSDKSKAGQLFNSKKIFSTDEIAFKNDEYFIVIASGFYKSIKHKLLNLGYKEYFDMCGTVSSVHKPFDYCDKIQLEITRKCNLKCHFCEAQRERSMNHLGKDVYKDMPLEAAKKIIDDAIEADIKNFHYVGSGENMMHKNYSEILRYAGERFECITIITNGHLLNEEITDAILSNENKSKIFVNFSATGYSAETYNDFQGSGSNDKSDKLRNNVYNKILSFIDERNKRNKTVSVELKYLLTDDNLNDFKEYVRFWENKVDFINTYPIWPLDTNRVKQSVIHKCSLFERPFIQFNGDTSYCCGFETFIGNTINTPIGDLIKSDAYMKVVNNMINLNYDELDEVCKQCMWLYYNDYATGVDYLRAKKFDPHLDRLETIANGRPVLFFSHEQTMNELFYSIYVNKTIEQFNLSICDPYEKGHYERFEILAPSVDVFKDKFVVSFDDFELKELDHEIRDAAYKIISYKDIRDADD